MRFAPAPGLGLLGAFGNWLEGRGRAVTDLLARWPGRPFLFLGSTRTHDAHFWLHLHHTLTSGRVGRAVEFFVPLLVPPTCRATLPRSKEP